MIFRSCAIVAALTFVPVVAHAVSEANFDAKTTADLVALCEAKPDDAMGIAAVNFCQGFAQGAVLVEMQNLAASRGPKLFCLPDPPPTRNEAIQEFIPWARSSPERMSEAATNGLVRFLSERFPCPKSR